MSNGLIWLNSSQIEKLQVGSYREYEENLKESLEVHNKTKQTFNSFKEYKIDIIK